LVRQTIARLDPSAFELVQKLEQQDAPAREAAHRGSNRGAELGHTASRRLGGAGAGIARMRPGSSGHRMGIGAVVPHVRGTRGGASRSGVKAASPSRGLPRRRSRSRSARYRSRGTTPGLTGGRGHRSRSRGSRQRRSGRGVVVPRKESTTRGPAPRVVPPPKRDRPPPSTRPVVGAPPSRTPAAPSRTTSGRAPTSAARVPNGSAAHRKPTATPETQAAERAELERWLRGLDPSGVLTRYSPAVHREFSNLSEVAAALVEPTAEKKKSLLNWVEPSVFNLLGISSLGHKLMLAKGIAALRGHA